MDDIADQRSSTATAGDLIGESCEHTSRDRLVAGALRLRFKALITCNLEKLLEELLDLSGSVGMDREWSDRIDAKLVTVRIRECPDENEKVGNAVTENFCTLLLDSSLSSQQEIARLRQGGDECGGPHALEVLSREKHSRIARMDREAQHAAANLRDFTGTAVQSAEV